MRERKREAERERERERRERERRERNEEVCARTYDDIVIKFKNRDGKREFKRWKWGWKGRRVERKERNKETELEKKDRHDVLNQEKNINGSGKEKMEESGTGRGNDTYTVPIQQKCSYERR